MKKLCALAFLFLTLACGCSTKGVNFPFAGAFHKSASSPETESSTIAGHPAPNFTWDGPPKANSFRAIKGQPVVLIIAKNSRVSQFRAQVKKLRELFQKFASEKVVFVAAIEDEKDNIRSDIPFAMANNPTQVAADFGSHGKFGIVIIGRDGNIDYATTLVLPASRIHDVIENSFVPQADRRKQ